MEQENIDSNISNLKIAVVGLGYVGLPLADALAKHFYVIGFDINESRIKELKEGIDSTNSVSKDSIGSSCITFTSDQSLLKAANIIIVAVPTPITKSRQPDLSYVIKASEIVAKNMSKGSTVVYESTVYPGATEEDCLPVLEVYSGLKHIEDFNLGYSPERINPGDFIHTIDKIVKIVAGDCPETTDLLADVYGKITKAGIHKAPSIKVAEAAKVIENTQRDLNIALMNELAIIFDKLEIDTKDVLEAAGTKWNFIKFSPGLVGGHCIGVDPYYLTYKAESVGYHPQVILGGRRINDNIGKFVVEKTIKLLIKQDKKIHNAKIGIFGLTFKENVPDMRNTKVLDIYNELLEYGINPIINDPIADHLDAKKIYGAELSSFDDIKELDVIIVAVGHNQYTSASLEHFTKLFKNDSSGILIDIKSIWSKELAANAGIANYWRL